MTMRVMRENKMATLVKGDVMGRLKHRRKNGDQTADAQGGLHQFNQFNDLCKSGTINLSMIIMLSGASVPPSEPSPQLAR